MVARNASIEPGKDAVLSCAVFSTVNDVEVKWYRGLEPRFELRPGKTSRYSIQTDRTLGNAINSTLSITRASESDTGKYICEASHKGGTSSADGFINIHVRPRVSVDSEEVTFRDGGTLMLTCQAQGLPPPRITWSLNDMTIAPSSPLTDSYRISNYQRPRISIRRTALVGSSPMSKHSDTIAFVWQ
ncbi:unnamed protein product [Protopolystoma xenopodis]|uniref:Ig-like domain-containing protein n=1 Tax=Protopolystoma xenopodis TaxID=117903 RepID=A0A3S5BE49_9PLAT|nr:unnamed protein product [Protopolystoma xenopodis]